MLDMQLLVYHTNRAMSIDNIVHDMSERQLTVLRTPNRAAQMNDRTPKWYRFGKVGVGTPFHT